MDKKNQGSNADLSTEADIGTPRHEAGSAFATISDVVSRSGADQALQPMMNKAKYILGRFSEYAERGPKPDAEKSPARVVFDVTDLLDYFRHSRLPTGVQRVQIEITCHILKSEHADDYALAGISRASERWVEIEASEFVGLCALSLEDGDASDPVWCQKRDRLTGNVENGSPLIMADGQILCALGTAWHTDNYFLRIRDIKRKYNIYFVPFIHDVIPIVAGKYCSDNDIRNFVNFFLGAIGVSDFYLCNSEASKSDLIAITARVGAKVDPGSVVVVPLDADFRRGSYALAQSGPATLSVVPDLPFILMVATIEARKNQLGVLDAYQLLLRKHGSRLLPKIVFVGKLGYGSERIRERIESNSELKKSVTILSNVSDAALQQLYKKCIFTIYPSFYEGWGLPVTESLCYGKVPFIARNSSLLEAGRDWAVYHETGSVRELAGGLEKLIFETEFRNSREKYIAESFEPRAWSQISDQIHTQISLWLSGGTTPRNKPAAVDPGNYYPMRSSTATSVWRGLDVAEKYRVGDGWWQPESPGCWMRPSGARLEFSLDRSNGGRLGFEVMCPGDHSVQMAYLVRADCAYEPVRGQIAGGQTKWVFLEIRPDEEGDVVTFEFSTTWIDGLKEWSLHDRRDLGVGLKGFYVFDVANPHARLDFLERVALGSIEDVSAFRDHGSYQEV